MTRSRPARKSPARAGPGARSRSVGARPRQPPPAGADSEADDSPTSSAARKRAHTAELRSNRFLH